MRFFNTAGPVDCRKHYCISPLERFDLDQILSLIEQEKYFALHAPRQTGKTSCLLALLAHLNQQGRYRCVYMNMEVGQAARENVAAAMQAIAGELADKANIVLNDDFVKRHWPEALADSGPYGAFGGILSRWSADDPKPLVLLIDEIDALVGDTLIAILRQLRAGYAWRPGRFPQSVILCGVRDVRDYRIHSDAEKAVITGGSAFNIKAKSLRLGDFSLPEVEALYRQHKEETGQALTAEALARVWELTQGQPWLVNALGYETCFELEAGRNRSRPMTADDVEQAKENLIQRRETHLDQLADKLEEERVRRVIEPLLAGVDLAEGFQKDDVDYVVDLGLIKRSPAGVLKLANPIYQEVVPRELVADTQDGLVEQMAWYVNPAGTLNLDKLLAAFQAFFREHSEHWLERFRYKEAGPQLLMQAFLQRIVNGGGRIEREYGLGRMRTDLLIVWPYPGGVQKTVIELKVLHKGLEQTLAAGLEQTWKYLDRSGATEGHLVMFDRTPDKPWEEKLFRRQETVRGKTIQVWGM